MKLGESLKNYVNYFQSLMALVYNCNEDITVATFISGLQVTHSFYKYLVKNKVTKMRDILIQTQKYMQIGKATRSATTRPPKEGSEGEKPKQQFPLRKNLYHNSFVVHKPRQYARESNKDDAVEPDLIPFKIPVDHVFNAIKDKPWVKHATRPLSQNPKGPRSRDYYAFHDGMGHPTIECRTLRWHFRIWLIKDTSESLSSTQNNQKRKPTIRQSG